jgi:hypothetical protein
MRLTIFKAEPKTYLWLPPIYILILRNTFNGVRFRRRFDVNVGPINIINGRLATRVAAWRPSALNLHPDTGNPSLTGRIRT